MPLPPFQILGIGEVLWDILPSGRQLGGAPANFTWHAHALGGVARMVSRVGDDALGHEIMARWQKLGLPVETLSVDAEAPTGTVSVALGVAGTAGLCMVWGLVLVVVCTRPGAVK